MTDIISIVADPNVTKTSENYDIKNNCKDYVTSYNAVIVGSSPWLSVVKKGPHTIAVVVNTKAGKGADTAGKHYGNIKISSSGLADFTVSVILTVTGQAANCSPSKAVVTPASITKTGSGTAPVSVKDDCQNNLAYTVDSVTYQTGAGWISAPADGNGQMNVSLNSSGLTDGATYKGVITITPNGYKAVSIPVTFNVSSASQTQGNAKVIAFGLSGNIRFWVSPETPYYYSFEIPVESGVKPRGVKIEDFTQTQKSPGPGTHNVDILVKYAGKKCDTKELPDFNLLTAVKEYCEPNKTCQPRWTGTGWSPKRYGEAQGLELFYRLSSNSAELLTVIGDPLPDGCYYIMLYNTGTGRGYIALTFG